MAETCISEGLAVRDHVGPELPVGEEFVAGPAGKLLAAGCPEGHRQAGYY